MSDLEEYGLEMEPDNYGADPDLMPTKPVRVKKSGIGGKILALALGFVMGAGGVIGGVAGAGYWVASQPVQDTLDTVNGLTGANIDFSQYISPEYAKLKIMELVGEITTVASNFASGKGCLNDLAKISPYVGTVLDPLLTTLEEFGLSLNKEDLMAIPVSELPTHLLETAKDMKLVDLLKSVGANTDETLYKAICYTEDNQPVTLRTLLESPSSLLDGIPLATLLIGDKVIDPAKDSLLLSIAYGNSNRYVIDTEQNIVVMNAMRFTKEGDKFYDIDGNEVTATSEDGVYTLTIEGEKLYLNPSASEANVYLAYDDTEFTTPICYRKVMLGDLMNGGITDVFYTIELGSLLNVSPFDTDPDPLILALAYGEEGTHYEIVGDKIVWKTDNEGKAYKPRTLGDLLEGNFTDIVYDVKLGTLLKIDPLQSYDEDPSNDPQKLMLALAYGEEGEHYEVVLNTNNEYEIKWLLKEGETDVYHHARTVRDLIENSDTLLNDIRLGTILDINPLQNYDSDPSNDANEIMLALAYGYEGTHYTIESGKLVWQTDTEGNKYKPKTVRSLTEGDAFGTLRLATVLDVKIDEEPTSSNAMTHAIAFGYKGTDFKFVNGKACNMDGTPYDGYRTVSDMSNMNDIINSLRIETALSIKPDPNSTRLLQVLAYGSDLEYVDNGDGTYSIVNPEYNTIADLSSSENNLIDRLTIGDILGEENIKDDTLLSHLGNATLSTLSDEVGKLTFKQVYPRQIFQNDYVVYEGTTRKVLTLVTGTNGAPDYYEYEDGTLYRGDEKDIILEYYYNALVDENGVTNNTSGYIAEDKLIYNQDTKFYNYTDDAGKTYEVHLVLTGQWKYLLVDPDDANGYAHDYPLTDFAALVSNMTKNMTKAKLYDLNEDGIITLSDDTLNTKIVTNMSLGALGSFTYSPQGTTASNADGLLRLGDLTVTQIMDYTAALIKFMDDISKH